MDYKYITVKRKPGVKQISIFDVLNDNDVCFENDKDTKDTYTYRVTHVSQKLRDKIDWVGLYGLFTKFNEKYKDLIEMEDMSGMYRSFKIPKRSGGLRQIDAPNERLREAMKDLKKIFEKELYASYHTSCFSYVHGRSIVDCQRRHQENKSKWFLKLDFSGFFPSTSPEFLMSILYKTYPLCCIAENPVLKSEFEKAMRICFLNGGLPQGSPMSPMLTVMMMIPIDYTINRFCRTNSPHMVYTRYADDIEISCEYNFHWREVISKIKSILAEFNAPFTLNDKKTRYGSSAGRNWNLGLMLNKDNEITVGHEKKKVFKAMIYQFMSDTLSGRNWALEDVQHLNGLLSYYRSVEKDNIDAILAKYSEKFGTNVKVLIKHCISQA